MFKPDVNLISELSEKAYRNDLEFPVIRECYILNKWYAWFCARAAIEADSQLM